MKKKIKKTTHFAHLLDLLSYCFGVSFHTNVVLKKVRFRGKNTNKLEKYRINFSLTMLKGKLE